MLKTRLFGMVLTVMVLFATLGSPSSDNPKRRDPIAKGTKTIGILLSKGEYLPEKAVRDSAVDVIGEISEPVKTGIALLNVRLLDFDAKNERFRQGLTLQVTPVQLETLWLMNKNNMKLRVKLHEKENPNPE